MPAPKFLPVGPRMTAVPPVMYSQPWSPQPSTTACAPGGRGQHTDQVPTGGEDDRRWGAHGAATGSKAERLAWHYPPVTPSPAPPPRPKPRTAVAHAEALRGDAPEVCRAADGSVQRHVADDHLLLGGKRRLLGRVHGQDAARQALAHIVVGVTLGARGGGEAPVPVGERAGCLHVEPNTGSIVRFDWNNPVPSLCTTSLLGQCGAGIVDAKAAVKAVLELQ